MQSAFQTVLDLPSSPLAHITSACAYLCCAGLLVSAAASDLASRTIPNWISAVLLAVGLAFQLRNGTLGMGLISSSLVFAGSCLAWRGHLMGGGDVKLLTALSFCVPPLAVLPLITSVAAAGGVLGLIYLGLRRIRPTLMPVPAMPRALRAPAERSLARRVLRAERWRINRGTPVPYGIAIAVGGLLTLF